MNRSRRATFAVVGIAALAVVAVLAVFAFGVRNRPSFPSVEERPDPALIGTLAYSTWEDREGRCLWVQEIGAERRRFGCEQEYAGKDGYVAWFGFDDEGHLLVARYAPADQSSGQVLVTYDRSTFAELSRRPWGDRERPDRTTRADGAEVFSRPGEDDGEWEVLVRENGVARTVLSMRGPDDYYVYDAFWSTDGRWIVVGDQTDGSDQRYLVMAADGEPDPRVLVGDANELAWYQPSA